VTEDILLDAMDKMDKAVEHVQAQFSSVRTGRAAPALVEKLNVEYYGSPVPLQQLAAIQVPEARQLLVKPHDRTTLNAIEKAIRDSDLGVAPSNGRVAVRNIRRDARKHMEALEKAGEISADDLERAEKELEKVTHDHVERIDAGLGRKEHELLEV
jgi:ribosome recycling factor